MKRWQWIPAAAGMVILALALPGPAALAQGEEDAGYEQSGMSGSGDEEKRARKRGPMDVVGAPVLDRNGERVGRVANVELDESGRVRSLVLSIGGVMGMGDTAYRVPWDELMLGDTEEGVVLGVARERMKSEFSAFEVKREREREMKREKERMRDVEGDAGGGQ